ncbi:hypothetical protein MesoLj131c_47200 [Mesorhizobium sp. 131-3-5]|uniref:hypothetical protein n=1 Tax=Mesorhizobium sp. 131-3-5 TaxID=2744520 RepID=UPI0019278B96|nr:hypothetical protein [Mesorhizobium sp. 131-3-5]BCH10462.1 hypothetical protein MesoLj131c_47200 [Mesorhizobium sp. 131-3-5]
MEQQDREPDFLTQEIARWVLETPKQKRPRAAVVEIRERFPQVGPQGACRALALANKIRSGGADAAA